MQLFTARGNAEAKKCENIEIAVCLQSYGIFDKNLILILKRGGSCTLAKDVLLLSLSIPNFWSV